MLQGIGESVRRCKLSFHMDGARFANAIATLGVAPSEVTWKRGVDVLCFGGTKNGMAVGDCVVFFNRELGQEFEYRCKQAGQLASKMRFLSAPWVGLLTDDIWLRNARHANAMAQKLATGLEQLGVRIAAPVESNAVFADFASEQTTAIRKARLDFLRIRWHRKHPASCVHGKRQVLRSTHFYLTANAPCLRILDTQKQNLRTRNHDSDSLWLDLQ